jgi:peptide/nickel transport system substrate-binding protein
MQESGWRPIDRRTLLAGAGSGMLAFYLAACGGSSSQLPPTSSGPAPSGTGSGTAPGADLSKVPGPPAGGGKRGGSAVVAWSVEGNSYDPAIGYSGTAWDSICNLTFAPLYSYGTDSSPQPNCAADMPKISSDGLVYTIPLRKGVTFHNGRAVVAADYKYAWERVLDPKLESWASSYIYTIKGASELFDGKATELTGVRVVDDMTLEVTLTQPDVTFLYALTQPFMAPVPKEAVQQFGADFSTNVVGNGPFRLAKYDSAGQNMLFQRHEGYHWQPLPYLDSVEYRWGIDSSVQLLELEKGNVQLLADGLDAQLLAKMKLNDALKNDIFQQPLWAQRWVNLDQRRVKGFANQNIRLALNYATDRDALGRVTGAEAENWGAPFPKSLPLPRTLTPYNHDAAKVSQLLAAAGQPPPSFQFWVDTDYPEDIKIGQVLQNQWKQAGFDVTIKQASGDAINELVSKGKCDAWVSSYYFIYPTAIDIISQYYETGGTANYTKYSNPQVDSLTAQARKTTDAAARDQLLAQVEQVIFDDAPGVYLQSVNWLMGVDLQKLQNFTYNGVYGAYYDRLWVA